MRITPFVKGIQWLQCKQQIRCCSESASLSIYTTLKEALRNSSCENRKIGIVLDFHNFNLPQQNCNYRKANGSLAKYEPWNGREWCFASSAMRFLKLRLLSSPPAYNEAAQQALKSLLRQEYAKKYGARESEVKRLMPGLLCGHVLLTAQGGSLHPTRCDFRGT